MDEGKKNTETIHTAVIIALFLIILFLFGAVFLFVMGIKYNSMINKTAYSIQSTIPTLSATATPTPKKTDTSFQDVDNSLDSLDVDLSNIDAGITDKQGNLTY